MTITGKVQKFVMREIADGGAGSGLRGSRHGRDRAAFTARVSSPPAWRGWARRRRSPCSRGRARWSGRGATSSTWRSASPTSTPRRTSPRRAIAALRAGETHYCPAAGIAELREAAAAELSRTRGVSIAPERVLVANGAKPFLFFTILATCEPGDEVVYPDPGFPIYESAIRWVGATPVPLPLREELEFSFAVEDLRARLSARTKLVILNSPQNPTGGVTPAADLAAAAQLILETPAWVLTDEVYARLIYGDAFASIASEEGMLERTVLLDGFSKTYAMTGWRCGYAAVPEALVEPLTRFFVNSTSCVPPFVQHAGVAALTGPQDDVTAMVAEFAARRDLVVDGLNALPGVSCLSPRGAFYVFPNVARHAGERRGARRPPARGGRRRGAGRHRVRGAGRRPPAAVLRELPGQPDARARAHGRLPRQPLGALQPSSPVASWGAPTGLDSGEPRWRR